MPCRSAWDNNSAMLKLPEENHRRRGMSQRLQQHRLRRNRLPLNNGAPYPVASQAHHEGKEPHVKGDRRLHLPRSRLLLVVPSVCSSLLQALRVHRLRRSQGHQPSRSRRIDSLSKTLRRPTSQQALLVRVANSRNVSSSTAISC